jgi:predicted transposase YbfD/YdcC
MGCQKDIAEMVVQNKGDYILALKGNHKNFHEDVEHLFSSELDSNSPSVHFEHHKDLDYGHSRLERRKIAVTHDIEWLTNKKEWRGLKSLVMVESDVQGGRNSTERRYFISSLRADAREFGKHIRAHWGIENSLHWVLDVVFREDDSRIRNEKAAENMAIFRHTALNLLQMAKTEYKRMSIKRLRKLAGWSEEHLEKILSQRL